MEMEQKLYEAAVTGTVSLSDILKQDKDILNTVGFKCLNSSPLHVAVSHGHINLVRDILLHNPDLAEANDARRSTALHLAAAKGTVKMVKLLLEFCPDGVTSRDIEGRNPIHLAAIKGNVKVLKYLVRECPYAAQARLHQGEGVLHLCVHHNKDDALKKLLRNVDCPDFINAKDDFGNTVLHLLVKNKKYEIARKVLLEEHKEKVIVNAINSNGKTAMDILLESAGEGSTEKDKLADYLEEEEAKTAHQLGKMQWLTKNRDTLMIVASLIAAMAFQAGMSPPGGVWQENSETHKAGEAVMAYNYQDSYPYFLRLNTLGLVGSMSTILLLISELPFKNRIFMWFLVVIMWLTVSAMAVTYSFAITVVTPEKDRGPLSDTIVVGVIVWGCLMAVLLVVHTIRLMVKLYTEKPMKKIAKRYSKLKSSVAGARHGRSMSISTPRSVIDASNDTDIEDPTSPLANHASIC